MAFVSVAEAARRLGVGVPRVHQRIKDGSLRAERIGSQWVVDELSVLRAGERRAPGRPLSARSAWALIALSDGDEGAVAGLLPAERSRARERLQRLLASAREAHGSEVNVRRLSSELRMLLRNRAERRQLQAAAADLGALREDPRWRAVVGSAENGIASSDVEGYLVAEDLPELSRAFLLVPASEGGNVVAHVVDAGQHAYPGSRLRLAADLAEHRGPREELKAFELMRQLAAGWPERRA